MTDPILRSQPFSDEAERSLLSALLNDPALIDKAADELQPDEIYHPANRLLYGILIEMRGKNLPIELGSVQHWLIDSGNVDKVGGLGFVPELIGFAASSPFYGHYRKIVGDKALLRKLIAVSTETMQKVYEIGPQDDPLALLDDTEIRTLAIRPRDSGETDLMSKHIVAAYDEIAAQIQVGNAMTGKATGFQWLDSVTHGIRPEMWYIGARPSVGKSALLLQLLLPFMERGECVGMFSLEMSRMMLNKRLISLVSGVSFARMMGGILNPLEQRQIIDAVKRIKGFKFLCDDRSGLTHQQIRAKARRWHREHGINVVGIDYLQRMQPSTMGRKNRNQSEEHAENSTSLTDGVKELGIPWLVAAQLNRECEKGNRRPRLSDFEGCGRIEQDADVALLMSHHVNQPDDEETSRHVLFDICKQRNGGLDSKPHLFRKHQVKFEAWPIEEKEDREPNQSNGNRRNDRGQPTEYPYA